MHYQAHDVNSIREGVEKYGVAGGARVMMSNEYLHADEAVKSGIYMTYYCPSKKIECFRVGSNSKCFCGHLFKEHNKSIGAKKINTSCLGCPCKAFMYIPTRPEECGMWWLPRRKEFDVRTWKAKCKCKHAHDEHNPTRPMRCKMCHNCSDFHGDFACISCDMAWHDHEMLYESEQERRMEKKPVGQAYYPLADQAEIQEMVFDPTKMNKATPFMRPRPNNNPKPEPKKAIISQPKNLPIEYGQGDQYEEYKGNQPSYGVTGQGYSNPLSSQKVGTKSTGIGFGSNRGAQQEEEEDNYVVMPQKTVSKPVGTGLTGTRAGGLASTTTTKTTPKPSVSSSKGSAPTTYKKPTNSAMKW